jgi:phytoene dehydrogenase-like protein
MMMMRPYTGASQYGTEVDGLYLCGAGAHPGGGVMGLVGRNAAREIIKRKGAA